MERHSHDVNPPFFSSETIFKGNVHFLLLFHDPQFYLLNLDLAIAYQVSTYNIGIHGYDSFIHFEGANYGRTLHALFD